MSDGTKPWAINLPLVDFIGSLLSPEVQKADKIRAERVNYSATKRGPGRRYYYGMKNKKKQRGLLKQYSPRANLQAQRVAAEHPEKYMHAHARRRYLMEKENARVSQT